MIKNEFIEMLSEQASKIVTESIAKRIIDDPTLLDQFYELTFDENRNIAWRSLWVCNKIAESAPLLLSDKYNQLVDRAMNATDDGIMRLLLNIVLHIPQPTDINVAFLDFCIENMVSFSKTSSCQAVCMKLAYKMCSANQPELLVEIKAYLENMDDSFYNHAATSAKRAILKNINKNKR